MWGRGGRLVEEEERDEMMKTFRGKLKDNVCFGWSTDIVLAKLTNTRDVFAPFNKQGTAIKCTKNSKQHQQDTSNQWRTRAGFGAQAVGI
jgi:hypothetical protein